ncbi:MAG: tetratricopeptide repeat protein, partial [Pseudomonadota bacterium]
QAVEEQIWREWARSGSDAMDLLLDRARDAMEEGQWEDAIEHLTALTDHAPEFAEGWNARATAYFQVGLFGPSLEDIERTLALNPRHFGALAGLGMIMNEVGMKELALQAYRRAHELHPHRPDLKEAVDILDAEIGGQAL